LVVLDPHLYHCWLTLLITTTDRLRMILAAAARLLHTSRHFLLLEAMTNGRP